MKGQAVKIDKCHDDPNAKYRLMVTRTYGEVREMWGEVHRGLQRECAAIAEVYAKIGYRWLRK